MQTQDCVLFVVVLLVPLAAILATDFYILLEILRKQRRMPTNWLATLCIMGIAIYAGVLSGSPPLVQRLLFLIGQSVVFLTPLTRLYIASQNVQRDNDPEYVYRNVLWLVTVPSIFAWMCLSAWCLFGAADSQSTLNYPL